MFHFTQILRCKLAIPVANFTAFFELKTSEVSIVVEFA